MGGCPPDFSASCFFSASFMAREASQTSVVPLMRALMPVPEPPPVTWMVVEGCFFMYSSAQRCPSTTMVSDPLTVTVPASAGRADAAPASMATAAIAIFAPVLLFIGLSFDVRFASFFEIRYSATASRNRNSCSQALFSPFSRGVASLSRPKWLTT